MGKELTACSSNDIKITIAQPGLEKWFALLVDLRRMVAHERLHPNEHPALQNIDWRDSFLANFERTLQAGYPPPQNQLTVLSTLTITLLGRSLPI